MANDGIGSMSTFSRLIFEAVSPNMKLAGYLVFAVVFLLSAIVYKLGFAKKLPPGKNAVIYAFLFLGCTVLTFLAYYLPVIDALLVAVAVLVLYKIRLRREKKSGRLT